MAAERVQEEVEGRFGRLESDMAHMRTDLADVKLDQRDIRDTLGKMYDSITTLRDEMHQADLKLAAAIASVEFKLAELYAKLDHKIDRKSLTDRLWMLSVAASLLAVMAHGFKWI
jgi:septation ring formation regulator EzrA